MKRLLTCMAMVVIAASAAPGIANSEILAMMNYESKPAESLKALKLTGAGERREGIAIIDVDPEAPTFGKILMDIPLPPDLVAHHIFYDRKMEKAYITALGKPELHVFKLNEFPYRLRRIDVPKCVMGEDVLFSEDNSTWYLTCMNSGNVYVGETATDKITGIIDIPGTNPHGLVVLSDIDRLLVTSTITGDLKTPKEELIVVQASTNKVLGTLKMSNKPSPSGVAPVELLRVPGSDPAIVYTTNMFGAALWTATWNPGSKSFDVAEAFNLAPINGGVPLEIYFVDGGKTMYITTANPGLFHIFDLSADPSKPKLVKSMKTGQGAHHVGLTKDGRYGFVQNSFINLPGMRDGSVSVVDLKLQKVVASMDTLKNMGFNPNCIVLLPKWNHLAGH
ncbi:MAG: YncE family protein [Rhodospirillaceae bacterium]|nr:YncE family protein [Rhodospirillaceae bacterium]MBT6429378.1 YncE family protein [Rhodospirillaceae bacterium]